MQRLFHLAFLAIIGIALLVETARFGFSLSGAHAPTVLEQAGVFVLLASAIAFVKFILSVLRSWKQPGARSAALGYLVVLLWPMLLRGIDSWVAVKGQAAVNNVSLERPGARSPSLEARPSEQFLAGQAWARDRAPRRRSECGGSEEFVRGCFVHILKTQEQEEAAGYRWATENRPQRPSDCPGKTAHEQLGCRKWHMAQPDTAHVWPYGTQTTADCKREVDSNGEVQTELFRLSGNEHGVASFRHRSWEPDLQRCEQLDRAVQDAFMVKAYDRLNAMVEKMKGGGALTQEDKATFNSDFVEMAKVRDQPYKEAYQKLANEFLDRQAGTHKDLKPQYPRISCDEYAAQIAKMRKLEAARVAEMQSLREPGGVIRNGVRWKELNKQRIDMMWDWKYFNDGATQAGCVVPAS